MGNLLFNLGWLLSISTGNLALASSDVLPEPEKLVLTVVERIDSEKGTPAWFLEARRVTQCPCQNCPLESQMVTKGNEFHITVGKPAPQEECIDPPSYPKTEIQLPIEEQREYFVFVNSEKYRLQVTREFTELKPIKQKLTRSARKIFYRAIPNLISVVCFRYQHSCEGKKKTINELCPKLFAAIGRIAKEANLKELAQRGQTLECTEEYRRKGQCRLYYYDGQIEALKAVVDSSNEFRLKQGTTAQCEPGNPPLYYRKIKTWKGAEVCC